MFSERKEFKKDEVVVVAGRRMKLLEGVLPVELRPDEELYVELFGDEPGCRFGIAKAIDLADKPTKEGWLPLYDVSFVIHDGGEWLADDIQGCCCASEGDASPRMMYWDPREECFQL